MNILIVSSIFPPEVGGPARQSWDLVKALKENTAIEPTVMTFGKSNYAEHIDGVTIYRVNRMDTIKGFVGSIIRQTNIAFQLIKVIQNNKIRSIYCQELAVFGLVTGLAARLLAIPSAVKYPGDLVYELVNADKLVHEELETIFTSSVKARILTLIEKMIFKLHPVIVAASRYQKQILVSHLKVNPKKVYLLPNFIKIIKNSNRKLKADFKVLLVNRVVPWKQIDDILELVKYIKNPNVSFMIIGAPADLDHKIKHLGFNLKIESIPFVSPLEVAKYYKKADLFLSLSRYEPFGIVFIEAAMAGLPVVAPKIGGIPEVVHDGQTGYLYKVNDWQDAAFKIDQIASDPILYERMSKQALKATNEYNIEHNIEKITDFYFSLNKFR